MNSATAQRPLHHTVGYDSVSPFPLSRSVLALHPAPMLNLFCAVWFFLFSVWARVRRGRVSPKGETGGIHCRVIYILSLLVYYHLPRTFLWASDNSLLQCLSNHAQNGICPRLQNSLLCFLDFGSTCFSVGA